MAHEESVTIPTKRPPIAELLAELLEGAEGRLDEDALRDMGIDTLHFVYSVLRAGGQIYAKLPDRSEPEPVDITLPGLLEVR